MYFSACKDQAARHDVVISKSVQSISLYMQKFAVLLEKSKAFYDNDDPGHDYAHILRVVKNCKRLGETVNANFELLLPAGEKSEILT